MQPLEHDFSRDEIALRAMDSLRERKTVNVSWWVRPQALQMIGQRRYSVGGRMGGTSHDSQVWQRVWVGCSLGHLAGRAESGTQTKTGVAAAPPFRPPA